MAVTGHTFPCCSVWHAERVQQRRKLRSPPTPPSTLLTWMPITPHFLSASFSKAHTLMSMWSTSPQHQRLLLYLQQQQQQQQSRAAAEMGKRVNGSVSAVMWQPCAKVACYRHPCLTGCRAKPAATSSGGESVPQQASQAAAAPVVGVGGGAGISHPHEQGGGGVDAGVRAVKACTVAVFDGRRIAPDLIAPPTAASKARELVGKGHYVPALHPEAAM